MKNSIKLTLLLSLVVSFISCAPEAIKTETKISIGAAGALNEFPGGLYLIAHKESQIEGQSLMLIKRMEGNSFSIQLENGEWQFGAFGWKGNASNDTFTGELKCLITEPMKLSGEDVKVDLSISKTGCEHSVFGDLDTRRAEFQPHHISFRSCAFKKAFDSTCDPGRAKSFRIGLFDVPVSREFDMFSQRQNPYFSKCYKEETAGSSSATTPIAFPSFEGFPVVVRSYADENCEGSFENHFYKYGFRDIEPTSVSNYEIIDTSQTSRRAMLSVNSNPCKDIAPSDVPFQSNGKVFICHSEQFSASNITGGSNEYHIVRDLDFGGSNATITPTLLINLFGNGRFIKNFNNPLFDTIQDGSSIKNLNIDNVTIDSNGALGVIAVQLYGDNGTVTRSDFRDINFTNITVISDDLGDVGTLFGYIDFSSSHTSDELDIRNINISKNIIIRGAGNNIGTLIGRSEIGSTLSKNNIKFQDIQVDNAMITGLSNVGGIFGYFDKGIISNSHFNGSITGNSIVGGIVGRLVNGSVHRVASNLNYSKNAGACERVGGLVGDLSSDVDDITISQVNSNLTIDGNDPCKYLGGIAGEVSDTASSALKTRIVNSRSTINANSTGNNTTNTKHGGLVGHLGCNDNEIFIEGNITDVNLTGVGKYRGGFIGSALGSNCSIATSLLRKSISNVDIASPLNSFDATTIGENRFISEVELRTFSNSSGLNESNTVSPAIINNAKFTIDGETTFDRIPAERTTPEWTQTGGDQLSFEVALRQLSNPNFVENQFNIGNIFDPLQIKSTDDWNLVASTPHLLAKVVKLMSNLNFDSQNFIPFGQSSNPATPFPFTGEIIPNSKLVENISKVLSANQDNIGIILIAGSSEREAIIGTESDPFVARNIDINLGGNVATHVGIVAGESRSSRIVAHVEQGSIHSAASGSHSIGGLVGIAQTQKTFINESSFSGRINVQNAGNVGGLIGNYVEAGTTFLGVRASKVSLDELVSNANPAGIFIGNAPNVNQLLIENSYATIRGEGVSDIQSNILPIGSGQLGVFTNSIVQLNNNSSGVMLNPSNTNIAIIDNTTDISTINSNLLSQARQSGLDIFPGDENGRRIQVNLFWEN